LTIEILDELGNAFAGPFNPTVFPNQTQSLITAVSPGVGWCRVTGISKGAARITLCVVDANTTCTAAVTVPLTGRVRRRARAVSRASPPPPRAPARSSASRCSRR
jgi:hypothetical protein